jgi:hypothetical protein
VAQTVEATAALAAVRLIPTTTTITAAITGIRVLVPAIVHILEAQATTPTQQTMTTVQMTMSVPRTQLRSLVVSFRKAAAKVSATAIAVAAIQIVKG